jgi:hypothetical protein
VAQEELLSGFAAPEDLDAGPDVGATVERDQLRAASPCGSAGSHGIGPSDFTSLQQSLKQLKAMQEENATLRAFMAEHMNTSAKVRLTLWCSGHVLVTKRNGPPADTLNGGS